MVDVDSAVLGNVSATWTANKNLSVTGYVRNVADHQYFTKTGVEEATGPGATGYVYLRVHARQDAELERPD